MYSYLQLKSICSVRLIVSDPLLQNENKRGQVYSCNIVQNNCSSIQSNGIIMCTIYLIFEDTLVKIKKYMYLKETANFVSTFYYLVPSEAINMSLGLSMIQSQWSSLVAVSWMSMSPITCINIYKKNLYKLDILYISVNEFLFRSVAPLFPRTVFMWPPSTACVSRLTQTIRYCLYRYQINCEVILTRHWLWSDTGCIFEQNLHAPHCLTHPPYLQGEKI